MYTDKIYKQYNKTPLVTFIVTCYNLPIWMIKECLESILALSLRPFEREIILVDDGSETSPVNELSGHLDDIIYVRQKNGGLSEARNAGIRMATGLYLQFVDGDDKLIQAGYEHCLDIVRYHDMPDMVLFDLSSKMTSKMTFTEVKPVCGTEYMQHNNIHPSSCGYIVKRTTLGELRFTPGIYHEDEEFTPQLLLRAEIIYPTLATAYFYRRRTGSIISDQNKRSILKRLNDKKQVIIRLNDMSDRLPHNDRTAINRRVAQLTMDYIYNIIIQIHSRKYLDKQLAELHSKGLFPLPDKEYTTKYKWFRRMTNSNMGLTVLMRTLPFLKKER